MNTLDSVDIDTHLLNQNGRIIHQVWFGTIPNKKKAKKTYIKLEKYRDSWKEKNPTWYHIEWNKEMSDRFVYKFYNKYYDLYRNYTYKIQKCDAIRYMILHRYGGLYVDMDYYCVKPFDLVFDTYKAPLYLVQTPNMSGEYVSNSLMFSVPQHKFWKALLSEMLKVNKPPMYYSKHLSVMYTTGPAIVNRVFHKFKIRYKLKSWPHKYFQPHTHTQSVLTLKNDKVYAIHMSGGCWHSTDSIFIVLLCKEWKFLLFMFVIIIIGILTYKLLLQPKEPKFSPI